MASWRELQEEIKEELEEERRRNPNRGLHPKRQELMRAIRGRNLEKVDRLLNQGVDPNFRDRNGDFPLHAACSLERGDMSVTVQIVERLVYMDANMEVQNRFSQLPLHLAACHSQGLVQTLLDKGCSINAQDNAGCTALMFACRLNRTDPVETVTLLVKNNANVHLTDEQGQTALHTLCQNKDLSDTLRNDIALKLLNSGLSATTADREGKMAVCYELDKLRQASYRGSPLVPLDLTETLVCGGSNLLPHHPLHQYWLRLMVTVLNPLMLLTLLQRVSSVLTHSSLRLVSQVVMQQKTDDDDDDDDNRHFSRVQSEVHRLSHTVKSLQCLCRLSVRARIRGKLLADATRDNLPLPGKLKTFLTSLNSAVV